MNRNYLRGRHAEYQCMAELRAQGYPVVMRAAGSHGPFDVIALGPNGGVCAQVKRTEGPNVPGFTKDLEALRAVGVHESNSKQLWVYIDDPHRLVIVPV